MKNLKPQKLLIAAICIVCAAALCVAAVQFLTPTFRGSRIKNPDAYLLDIERMNGTDSHTLELKKGDILQVQFETVQGSLNMEINAEDGTCIYCGNGEETTSFELKIPEDGCYLVAIEARQAKGTIHIILEEDK